MVDHVEQAEFGPLPISFQHAERAGRLPPHHRDPFDRMLVAQAQAEALTVVTRDPAFDAYEVDVLRCWPLHPPVPGFQSYNCPA